MNILILTPQLPYPPHQGTTLRNFNIIRILAQRHTIDLISFLAPDQQLNSASVLSKLCRRIDTLPQPQRTIQQRARDTLLSRLPDMGLRLESNAMHELVRKRLTESKYDVLQIEGIEMAQYGWPKLGDNGKIVFDDHNCEYLLQKRNCLADLRIPKRWIAAAYSLVQWQKLCQYEAMICRRSAAVVAVSQADAQALNHLTPEVNAEIIPNGIDLAEFHPLAAHSSPLTPHPTLVFTGKMDYRPNIDAVLWFGREVFPLIRQQIDDVCFQIVGMNPHARLDVLREVAGIEITGAVEDVRPFIHNAAAYVIPLRVGGGTRFKALEAMACAKPIISTSLGVEGIDVQEGRQMLIADTPQAFANAVLSVLRQPSSEWVQALCRNARSFVEEHYGWEQIVPKFEHIYAQNVKSNP